MFPVVEQDMLAFALALAAQEAAAAGFHQITSAHLLIALSKIADAATPQEGASAGVDALRREFGAFGISPKPFRRHLRSLIVGTSVSPVAEGGHRTLQCKMVFTLAVRVAANDRVELGLHHLLRAAMVLLSEVGPLSPMDYTDDIPNEL